MYIIVIVILFLLLLMFFGIHCDIIANKKRLLKPPINTYTYIKRTLF